jgi:hypothetical protein
MGDFQQFWCELILVLDPRNSLVAVVVVLLSRKDSIPPFSRPIPQEFNDFKQNKTHTHTHTHTHPKKKKAKK